MKCRSCTRPNLTDRDFTIERDGQRLRTAICRFCIAAANVLHNRQQKRRHP